MSKIRAFTIPYFSLTEQPPAAEHAPLSPHGIFGIDTMGGKYIREEKFSFFRISDWGVDKPFLMLVLSPLFQYTTGGVYIAGIRNNLYFIAGKWEVVMDALDEQTTLPSSITFDSQGRQSFLFEDRNFSNSKKYFWALQSLRLFAEYIEVTLRYMEAIVFVASEMDARERKIPQAEIPEGKILEELEGKFGKLRDRIERKRQEIQSLSDGLFSASSVAEGRLASEQNGNIRLLTLVTIAYLPLTLAASIYGMEVLPKTAGFESYAVVTVLMCAITYILVLKIRQIKGAISWGRSSVRSMLNTRKKKDSGQRVNHHEMASPVAARASSMV
ncbi:MAG: hypothetical protein Q9208_003140 [Pyrenodesmia sp. 3 TL-2023]